MSSTYNLHINIEPKDRPERLTAKSAKRGECVTVEISAQIADDNVILYLWGSDNEKFDMLDAIIDACVEAKRALTSATFTAAR